MAKMYKVLFYYEESRPEGGLPIFKKEIKLYDAENAEKLQEKIDEFLNDNRCGYRKNIKFLNVSNL